MNVARQIHECGAPDTRACSKWHLCGTCGTRCSGSQHLRAGGEEQPGTVLFAAEFPQQRAVDGGAVKNLDQGGAAVVGILFSAVADVKLLPSKVPSKVP